MTKQEILEGLHKLVSNNVIGSKQLMSRYKGFRGELFFENLIINKYPELEIIEGGIIISKDSKTSSLNNSIYFTIIPPEMELENYLFIYSSLKNLGFVNMYLIQYSNNWDLKTVMEFPDENIQLRVPKFEIYSFDNSLNKFIFQGDQVNTITDFLVDINPRPRNKFPIEDFCEKWLIDNLTQFSENQLLSIYLDRLFFDGFIGFSKQKGKSSDIDKIIKKPSGKYSLLEVKEKDLPKSKKGFGLDVPRIEDLNKIQNESSLQYYVVVRHINNQKDRNLVGWKYISISKFTEDVENEKSVEGGTGMRSHNTSNPTLICNLNQFSDL